MKCTRSWINPIFPSAGDRVDLDNNSKFTVFLDEVYTLQTRVDVIEQEGGDPEQSDVNESEDTEEDKELQKEAAKELEQTKQTNKRKRVVPPREENAPPQTKKQKKTSTVKKTRAIRDSDSEEDDNGEPNEYDYNDGFLVRDEDYVDEDPIGDFDDDRDTLREGRRFVRSFHSTDPSNKQTYK